MEEMEEVKPPQERPQEGEVSHRNNFVSDVYTYSKAKPVACGVILRYN